MVGWKSRWSRDRLVNPPTAKRTPSTRPRVSAWLETSITTVSTPRSTITASSACSSGASGVVSALGSSRPSIRMPTVPISPATRSAERRPASTRYVVVVLPDVPVTPMTRSFSDGCP